MKTISLIFFVAFSSALYSQDVIITVTGMSNDIPVELDTIVVYNYSNGTFLTLKNLPVGITDYEINLSQGSLNVINTLATTNEKIELFSNIPNKTEVLVSITKPQEVYTEVFDLSGKLLLSSFLECSSGENLIEIRTNCVSVIKVRSREIIASFKSIGTNKKNQVSIRTVNIKEEKHITKVRNKSLTGDFAYDPGDSLKITVIKNNYHSNFAVKTPQNLDHYLIYLSQPCQGIETVTDYDGNVYNTVQIGSQCWMKENLKTTHYADGTPLVDGTGMPTNGTTKYWFDYDDNPSNSDDYGKLYAWVAVMNGEASSNTVPSGVQGVCPDDWHVPSKLEWDTLVNYLGGENIAGGKLKATGYEFWNYPNSGANNQSGFSALPGGVFYWHYYIGIRSFANFAASTLFMSEAYYLRIEYNGIDAFVGTNASSEMAANSVRCVKD